MQTAAFVSPVHSCFHLSSSEKCIVWKERRTAQRFRWKLLRIINAYKKSELAYGESDDNEDKEIGRVLSHTELKNATRFVYVPVVGRTDILVTLTCALVSILHERYLRNDGESCMDVRINSRCEKAYLKGPLPAPQYQG